MSSRDSRDLVSSLCKYQQLSGFMICPGGPVELKIDCMLENLRGSCAGVDHVDQPRVSPLSF